MLVLRAIVAPLLLSGALSARINKKKVAKASQDCDQADIAGFGPFGELIQFNTTDEKEKELFVFHPDLAQVTSPLPVMIFSHGATGEWSMYDDSIRRYVSHGFVVVFPHIEGPEADTGFFTTDPMGGFTQKGANYAITANADVASPFFQKLDLGNMVLVGHSMGATATIMTASKLPAGTFKLAFAMHPGICGPTGPPPCLPFLPCSTWMPEDFEKASANVPLVMTTASNDGIFVPAPWGPQFTFGCFNKSTTVATKDSTAFAEFKEEVCEDDGTGGRFDRTWSTGGHDCPLKSGSPETRWVLVAAKLYAQLDGDTSSHCHAMLWGSGSDSLRNDADLENTAVNAPAA